MTTWRTARLDDVAQVFGGGTPSRQEPRFFGGQTAWATPTDVTSLNGLYISSTKEAVTDEGLRSSSTKLLPVGTVLLTSRATIGFTAVAQVQICTNQGFVNFVCGANLIPEFLAYWLRTQKPKMLRQAGGTTFKEIARGELRKFEISFPPLPEQRRIVDILSRAESIVRLRREAQKKTAELIPALFLDTFGDPATNPKDWQIRRVKDFVRAFSGGKSVQQGSEGESPFYVLKISAVTSGRYIAAERKPAPRDFAPPHQHFVRPGDMLFSRANTVDLVGATALVERTDGKTLLPDKLWRIEWSEPVAPRYMLALFQSEWARQQFGKLSSGTSASMRNISQTKLFELQCPIAPIEAQRRFEKLAEGVEGIATQQSTATTQAEATFNALLAQVFAPV